MTKTKLVISGPEETKEVWLDPKGVILGRGSKCDVVLDHSNVSRMHARISQDPFGRWIVEDLDSFNGVLVEGQRIKAQAVLPDQEISIHPLHSTCWKSLTTRRGRERLCERQSRLLTRAWRKISYPTRPARLPLYLQT